MNVFSRAAFLSRLTIRMGTGVAAVTLICAVVVPAHAAVLGHARVVSKSGDGLAIDVQVRNITDADRSSMTVGIAPLAAWNQAGLTPPVSLDTMRVAVASGPRASSIIQIRSDQRFEGTVADLLLDVGSAAGTQRHQVSLLVPDARSPILPAVSTGNNAVSGKHGAARAAMSELESITVRKGDNLFALSRRHAPKGVSIYQWMIAVHKANSKAFIRGDINLVKAGASLLIPDTAAMRALSDKQARRLFRDLTAGAVVAGSAQISAASTTDAAASGKVSDLPAAADTQTDATRYSLRLSVPGEQDTPRQRRESLPAGNKPAERVFGGNAGTEPAANEPTEAAGTASADGAEQRSAGTASVSNSETNSPITADRPNRARQANDVLDSGPNDKISATSNGEPIGDDGLAVRKGLAEAGGRVSQLESNIKNLNQAMQAQGLAATTLVEDSANEISQTLSVAGKALTEASAGAEAILAVPDSASVETNKVDKTVSWLQNNLLAIVTAILAILVLILAWALRRASGARTTRDGSGGVITEAMVKEKLDQINLDLAAEDTPAERTPKA